MKDIIEGNRLIAEFIGSKLIMCDDLIMGYELPNEFPIYYKYYEPKALKYHSSWDWIMPAIRNAKTSPNSAEYFGWETLNNELLKCDTPKYVFIELVSFIKWYNQNK